MVRSSRPKKVLVSLIGAALLVVPATAAVADADLSVAKSAPATAIAGANLTYSITVANAMMDAAADVELTDTTPLGTTFVGLTAPVGWICVMPAVGGTGLVSCTNASVAAGANEVFTLVVNVDSGTADGTAIVNTAGVTTTTTETDTANNSSTASTTVGLIGDLCNQPGAMLGTNGPDTLVGTENDDVICGGNGHDTIDGLGGNDVIVGGNGKDTIDGGAGDDTIAGSNGKDVVDGGEGNDTVFGRNGKDQLTGGPGLDVLVGGNGKDMLDAQDGAGGDSLDGGRGNDECLVDAGDVSTNCP